MNKPMKWKDQDECLASEELKSIERVVQEAAKANPEEAHLILAKTLHRLYALEEMVAEALYSTTLSHKH